MKKTLTLFVSILMFYACSSSKSSKGDSTSKNPTLSSDKSYFVMSQVSTDSSYGYREANPIHVGYNGSTNGPENERKFLNGLTGPNGEKLSYYRIGSCCPFENKKLPMGMGMLDKYNVTWSGLAEAKVIYIDMYTYQQVKAPVGFAVKKN